MNTSINPAEAQSQGPPVMPLQPQSPAQDHLKEILRHLYLECLMRYPNDSFYGDGQVTSTTAISAADLNLDDDYGMSFTLAPRYIEDALLNEGTIDVQRLNEETQLRNELFATISTATIAGLADGNDNSNGSDNGEAAERYCPRTFDGYLCWPRTPAGTMLSQYCPDFVEGFNNKFLAHKTCLDNGTWFQHPISGQIWSNYTNCIDHEDLEFRQFVNDMYVKGYSISLLALLISIIIFLGFKSLRCTRIRIHVHLFASLALTCIAWILWYKFVVAEPELLRANPPWCIGLHLVVHYFMLVNYFWMFCEGLHLHLVLVVVFVKDTIVMRWFKVFSWIGPIFFVSAYGVARYFNKSDNNLCWINDTLLAWIFSVPITLSLLASFVFLINVLRVIVRKLHPQSAQPAPLAIRKAVRATIILVPLFGLQHFLLPYRPDEGTPLERFYQLLSVVLVSLQGLVVSFLFCFANHDVTFAIRTLLNKLMPTLVTAPPPGSNTGQLATTTPSRELGV